MGRIPRRPCTRLGILCAAIYPLTLCEVPVLGFQDQNGHQPNWKFSSKSATAHSIQGGLQLTKPHGGTAKKVLLIKMVLNKWMTHKYRL